MRFGACTKERNVRRGKGACSGQRRNGKGKEGKK